MSTKSLIVRVAFSLALLGVSFMVALPTYP